MKIKATRVMKMIYEVNLRDYPKGQTMKSIMEEELEAMYEDPESCFSNELLCDEITLEIMEEENNNEDS